MASEQDPYLAVLKASYDYEPQPDAEDELAIKENQLLLLLERTDDDWWKVKVKTDNQDEEGPSGLVPSAYVEPAPHISVVKALYDYEAQQPGELSVNEDEVLYVYGKEEEWLLVQSQTGDKKVGYVPGNYVEETSDEGDASEPAASSSPSAPDLSAIVIPDSPPKPAYTDPAELVSRSKAKAQTGTVETWSVSEVDKKGKKKKGTLGIGNGAMFFASESDKTPVQKWQTTDIQSTRLEKSKHVHIDIGGATPINLHFHAGPKDVADAIMAKLDEARALASPPPEESSPGLGDTPAALAIAAEPVERPRSSAKSVHFDSSEPEIIPPREEASEPEDEPAMEREEEDDEGGERAVVLYDFSADGDDEMTVHEGETLYVLERDTDEWWKCRNAQGDEGVVPANYLELVPGTEGKPAPPAAAKRDYEAEDRAAEEAREREREAQERRDREDAERKEKERKKAEAEKRAEAAAAAAEADRRRREKEREKQKEKERERAAAAAAEERERQKKAQRDSSGESSPRSSRDRGASDSRSSRSSTDKRPPPTENVRTWHDRTGQFRVDAAYLGFANGKIRLHKTNGVIIEVPQEKMSSEDMRYVEKMVSKQQHSPPQARGSQQQQQERKKATIDWFEFFLNAGCDVDDCTRYAQSFERDKIDEALLPDITESTMRSLGLREGDIIRVKKAIDQRQPKAKPDDSRAEQMRRDEELARQLQAEENGGTPRGQAPNLFAAGPNGALKANVRRGRPQPSKSLPPSTVDIQSISSASDQIQRTGTPTAASPVSTPATNGSAANRPPSRPSSAAAAAASGFDDDAWTNRPSSTRPIPPSSPARAPSAPIPPAPTPPAVAPAAPAPPPAPPAPVAPVAPPALPAAAPAPQPTATSPPATTGTGLANRTEADIFEQLARLSAIKPTIPPVNRPLSAAPALQPSQVTPSIVSPPPMGFQSGMGFGSSSLPIGQALQAQQTGMLPPAQTINPNAPRGPLAPIPANQSLLQPLVPTNSGFNSFVPTRPQSAPFQPTGNTSFLGPQPTGFQPAMQQQPLGPQPTGFQPPMSQPTGFQPPMSQPLMAQPTGFQTPVSQSILSQPTGFQAPGPLMSQPTGFGGGLPSFQNSGTFSPIQPNPTGFNPGFGQFNGVSAPPPVPPAQPSVNTNPANVFASMKSGTFGSEDSTPQPADKYNALRPNPTGLTMQATGWNGGYQPGFNGGYGYQR